MIRGGSSPAVLSVQAHEPPDGWWTTFRTAMPSRTSPALRRMPLCKSPRYVLPSGVVTSASAATSPTMDRTLTPTAAVTDASTSGSAGAIPIGRLPIACPRTAHSVQSHRLPGDGRLEPAPREERDDVGSGRPRSQARSPIRARAGFAGRKNALGHATSGATATETIVNTSMLDSRTRLVDCQGILSPVG